MKTRVAVSWSGGKDSALTLDRLFRDDRYDVVALVSTLDQSSQRVTAHDVRLDLVKRQADSIGLPLLTVELPSNPSNKIYLERFERAVKESGSSFDAMAFGDIFLEDLRAWREGSFSAMGLASVFPLWHASSRELSEEFFVRGFCAVICCVNGAYLDRGYLGRLYDARLLETLPATIDCCGENGEFHSFAFEGPIFREPIRYVVGATTYKPVMHGSPVKGHWFCDLVSSETKPANCPLCGASNDCAAAEGRDSCWCFYERIPAEVQNRVPPYARNLACICQACATSNASS
jgi:uncharacterized protein (TIGR00290 family)